MSDDLSHLTQMPETRSHNVCLDRLQKASKHCSTLLVQRLGVSLPFRQAFWTIYLSVCSDHDALMALTCWGDVATRAKNEPSENL